MRRGALIVAAALGLSFVPQGAAHASAEDLANSISAQVMSPFCPGVTLENCPSDNATELRSRIVSWAEMGWSRDRILTRLEDEYGSSILAVPPRSGSGLWAWLTPLLALIAGGGLAAAFARRWARRPRQPAPEASETLSAEMRDRLDDELRALRGRT
jgi:cytochrome c-type biogenesis protein CcmH